MINFKTGLSKEEKKSLTTMFLELHDLHGDFYLTKNNLRIFIKDNPDVLFDCLSKGDKIAFDENGVAVITGFSDKMPRKYLKILTKKPEDAKKYLDVIGWNCSENLYIKIKKTNPLKDILLANGFKFFGGRGKEILLMREGERHAFNNQTKDKSIN